MNYLEEQTDEKAMINSTKNGDQPLPHVTQVSIAGTTSTEQPLLKDKSMWSAQEKRVQKIDRLARSLLIQGLPNDIYSLIDSNKTVKTYGMLLRGICLVLNTVNKTGKLQFCMIFNFKKLILIFCEKVKMSRDVLTPSSTMRIPLLYRGEYSQWVERFMNYIEEQTDGEAMINSIKNGDQPLPRVTQVSIAGTTSTEQPPLKDKSMWSDQEKRV
nr:hypothetical protein [Tanacetum cinerariifolium]